MAFDAYLSSLNTWTFSSLTAGTTGIGGRLIIAASGVPSVFVFVLSSMADSLGPLASFKLLLGVSYAVEEVFEGVYILNEGGDDVIDS